MNKYYNCSAWSANFVPMNVLVNEYMDDWLLLKKACGGNCCRGGNLQAYYKNSWKIEGERLLSKSKIELWFLLLDRAVL